ncbi:hypothetical protein B0H12DRAFT_1069551 [Mycena haematopus]|nr:hypothetical protein B0H12DRAFT_1069551 [Mycena haematopus]
MSALCGGQNVKIPFRTAATWRLPHIMCLDEPTDYLDCESLKAFEAGCSSWCTFAASAARSASSLLEFIRILTLLTTVSRVWALRDGRLEASDHNWVEARVSQDDKYDATGNKIDSKKTKRISASKANSNGKRVQGAGAQGHLRAGKRT